MIHGPSNVKFINMDLQGRGQTGVHWVDLAQDRGQWRVLVIAVMTLRVPRNGEIP